MLEPTSLFKFSIALYFQGWMTEFEGDYDPFNCNVRLTRIAFVRLEGHLLSLSYPHPKHRIPKRPLWNDPPLTTEVNFVRHCLYNISGAVVSIAPEGLARNRAWNKKYPIAICFPQNSIVAAVAPGVSTEPLEGKENPEETNGKSIDMDRREQKKEILKEDCSFKTVWLFSRTDREKDDW